MQEEPRQGVLLQHEYLETVEICSWKLHKLPAEVIESLMKTLNRYVKKIGNVIII
jgi:hypothetical protein